MTTKTTIEHTDRLGQNILVDSYVVFSSSYSTGVLIGCVVKLTPKKIRVQYTQYYTRNDGSEVQHTYNHTPIPSEVVVLNDSLLPHLTMLALKGRI